MKWPLSIGQRDRTEQYDAYVIPVSSEDKIIMTQKAHKRAQKDLNKVLNMLTRTLFHYSESHYASSKAIELLAKQRQVVLNLKEAIKKETYNALPYKKLGQERIDEKEFMDNCRKRLSLKQKLIIGLTGTNVVLYAYGFIFKELNAIAVAIMFSMVFGGILYWRWCSAHRKTLKNSHTVGNKTKVW